MSIANAFRRLSNSRVALAFFAFLTVSQVRAATIVVNDASDILHGSGCATTGTGLCSLRDAITFANASAGADSIAFAVDFRAEGIALTSALPSITDTVTLDGTTQPGFAGTPLVELNGAGAGASAALQINASGCTVKGLAINRFGASALVLNSNNNLVSGNYIGTDVTGTIAEPNAGPGILVSNSGGNTIGGTAAGSGNLISGNGQTGIVLIGGPSTANRIQGNFIGTNAAGTAVVGNQGDGITLVAGAHDNTIGGTIPGARNLISGNAQHGVLIDVGSRNLVQGNFIGTNVSGTAALGNQQDGVHIHSDSNTIGGTTPAERNVISGNAQSGIRIESSGANANLIEGNLIGTDVNGIAALGNGGTGIQLGGANNQIGGTLPGAGNVISGNLGGGIHIGSLSGGSGAGNLVQGNFIGTDLTGTGTLGNGGHGVELGLNSVATNNTIGGTAASAGNTIAYNGGTGVLVLSGSGNGILGNSLFSNSGPGIDLNGEGVTLNDACDDDDGANKLQNFPILTTAFSTGSATTIRGILNSAASGTYRIEFFSNTSCDPSAYGEGRTFLGSTTVATDVSCNGSFNVTLPVTVSPQARLTATATDAANNTSEFSACISLAARYYTITPCRVVDTRDAPGPYGGSALQWGADRSFVFGGKCGIPPSATAVAINVVAVNPTTGPGFLTLYPGGASRPLAATINYNTGNIRANNAIIPLGALQDIAVHCGQGSGTTHMVIDVNGYFQ